MLVVTQPGQFTAAGFQPDPRRFSAAESDVIFNVDYRTDGVTFAVVALWLESLTGKATSAADVEAEYNARL